MIDPIRETIQVSPSQKARLIEAADCAREQRERRREAARRGGANRASQEGEVGDVSTSSAPQTDFYA